MSFSKNTLLILISILLNACKNDLELNAPYREYPSIYAVLNPQDRIQVIRINKVFLGEGDANVMAKVADSVNYQPGELSVTLTGPDARVITFRDSTVQTAEGAFSRNQRVYVTSEKIGTSGVYKLTVKNNRTGNIFTARANAIDSINAHGGYRPFTKYPEYPYPPGTSPEEYIDYKSNNGTIRFVPAGSAAQGYKDGPQVYALIIRLHFTDDQGVFGIKKEYVDYDFGNKYLKDAEIISGTRFIRYDFRSSDLFNAAGIALSKKNLSPNTLGRKMYKIEFIVYGSTQEYMDYLQYNSPSLSISQQKPLYSNFDNKAALGLFTFRSRASITKEMANVFISEFSRNPATCRYEFVDVNNQKLGCQ